MNNIKLLRTKMGMSQEQLSKQVLVTQTAVSQWEKGRTFPDVQTQKKLATLFNVTIDYLLGETDEPGLYYANNIQGSNFVQGNGTVTVGDFNETSKEEAELLRIYRELDVRRRLKLLTVAVELEDECESKKED